MKNQKQKSIEFLRGLRISISFWLNWKKEEVVTKKVNSYKAPKFGQNKYPKIIELIKSFSLKNKLTAFSYKNLFDSTINL